MTLGSIRKGTFNCTNAVFLHSVVCTVSAVSSNEEYQKQIIILILPARKFPYKIVFVPFWNKRLCRMMENYAVNPTDAYSFLSQGSETASGAGGI